MESSHPPFPFDQQGLVALNRLSALEPTAYLRHVFTALPCATTLAEIEPLLPRRIDRAALADPRRPQG